MSTCASGHDPKIVAHMGVEIKNKTTEITVRKTCQPIQFANKTEAINKLELKLTASS